MAFVMPYIHHDRFQDYFDQLKTGELQAYMGNLLIALRHVHSFGVIHRDVKPSNFLHDRKSKKYLLVDFGLAQRLEPEQKSTKPLATGQSNTIIDSSACDKQHSERASLPKMVAKIASDAVAAVDSTQLTSSDQQLANANKRKADEELVTDQPKRVRTLAISVALNSPQMAAVDGANTATENEKDTAQHVQYIPLPFKAPLKQSNEISTPKNSRAGNLYDSPITRHIKSAVLSYSLHSKMQEKRENITKDSSMTPPVAVGNNNTPKILAAKIPAAGHKYNVDNRRTSNGGGPKCHCYGQATVCTICIVKREIHAPRAGTPGYRPSEVLLKYPNQTTAVDVWAAGVILVSILSGCYPFFKSNDDITALAEIITVFGDEIVKKTALSLDRNICISRQKRPLHLRKLCIRLRNRCRMQNTPNDDHNNSTKMNKNCDNCEQIYSQCLCQDTDFNLDFSADVYPDSVYDLLGELLAINPKNRISADEALQHPFFKEIH